LWRNLINLSFNLSFIGGYSLLIYGFHIITIIFIILRYCIDLSIILYFIGIILIALCRNDFWRAWILFFRQIINIFRLICDNFWRAWILFFSQRIIIFSLICDNFWIIKLVLNKLWHLLHLIWLIYNIFLRTIRSIVHYQFICFIIFIRWYFIKIILRNSIFRWAEINSLDVICLFLIRWCIIF